MPKLPRISGAQCVRALERLGFMQARQRGSHVVLKRETEDSDGNIVTIGCTVPLHDELAVGTLSGVLKQASVSPDEFQANL